MKLSLSAAMRARDVSRPHDEHLAAAERTEPVPSGVNPASSRDAQPPTNPPETTDAPPRGRRLRKR